MAKNVTRDADCAACFDSLWDITWSRNPLDPSNFRRAPKIVRKCVHRGGYDIVHVHTPVAGFICRYALRNHSASVKICTAHGFHFHDRGSKMRNAVFTRLEQYAGRWTDYLIVINRQDEDAAKKYGFVAPGRLVYMPGIGVDTKRAYAPGSVSQDRVLAFRRSIQADSGAPVVLMIAEFIPRKRHADALYAWKKLGYPNAHLVFAGSGPTQSAMIALARQLGLEHSVHFLGIRSDIPVLIRASQAVLLCSAQEGLPRSIMEALSLGTPVIGSDIRGTRDLLQNDAGYLYPLGDVTSLVNLINYVLTHAEERDRRAKIGLQRIQNYDLAHILQLHEELYATALELRRRST